WRRAGSAAEGRLRSSGGIYFSRRGSSEAPKAPGRAASGARDRSASGRRHRSGRSNPRVARGVGMSRVFLDSNLFIYLFEDTKGPRGIRTLEIFDELSGRGDTVMTSTLTLGEVLVKPIREGDRA